MKKWIALLLASMMAFCLLTGCGASQPAQEEATTEAEEADTEASEETDSAAVQDNPAVSIEDSGDIREIDDQLEDEGNERAYIALRVNYIVNRRANSRTLGLHVFDKGQQRRRWVVIGEHGARKQSAQPAVTISEGVDVVQGEERRRRMQLGLNAV